MEYVIENFEAPQVLMCIIMYVFDRVENEGWTET